VRSQSNSPLPTGPRDHALISVLALLDEHLKNVKGACTPGYHALPDKIFRQIEVRVLRAAEFVGKVLIPFMMDDVKQYLVCSCDGFESEGARGWTLIRSVVAAFRFEAANVLAS
jgi:hypothetical protein